MRMLIVIRKAMFFTNVVPPVDKAEVVPPVDKAEEVQPRSAERLAAGNAKSLRPVKSAIASRWRPRSS